MQNQNTLFHLFFLIASWWLRVSDNHSKGHAGGNNAENDAESLLTIAQTRKAVLFGDVQVMSLHLQFMLQQGLTAAVGLALSSALGPR